MWGTLLQLGGQFYNAEMQSRANHKAVRKTRRVQQAEEQYGKFAQKDEDESIAFLKDLSLGRLRNQAKLAGRLTGPEMQEAGAAGEDLYGARLGEALDTANAGAQPKALALGRAAGTDAQARWGGLAAARRAPRLQSQANLVTLAGRRQGIDDFRQGQMDRLAEADISLNRKTAERARRSALLDAYRRRKLAGVMRANQVDVSGMRAQGEMIAALAGTGGAALNSYTANQRAETSGATKYEV